MDSVHFDIVHACKQTNLLFWPCSTLSWTSFPFPTLPDPSQPANHLSAVPVPYLVPICLVPFLWDSLSLQRLRIALLWDFICRHYLSWLLFCCLFFVLTATNKQTKRFWFHAAFGTFSWSNLDTIIVNKVSGHSRLCCRCSSTLKEHVFTVF